MYLSTNANSYLKPSLFVRENIYILKTFNETQKEGLKKEEKKYTEFFDLTVDDKNAKGNKLYLNDDRLLVSDKTRGVLYEFSLDKKSLDKNQSNEIKKSTLVALSEEKKYFYG